MPCACSPGSTPCSTSSKSFILHVRSRVIVLKVTTLPSHILHLNAHPSGLKLCAYHAAYLPYHAIVRRPTDTMASSWYTTQVACWQPWHIPNRTITRLLSFTVTAYAPQASTPVAAPAVTTSLALSLQAPSQPGSSPTSLSWSPPASAQWVSTWTVPSSAAPSPCPASPAKPRASYTGLSSCSA